MRWSCPHCGVNLAVSDEKIGSGWSFSRCYKCAGFALVRRAEINIIKVDKAPVGENVLLPEGSEIPSLSREAFKNLDSIIKAPEKQATAVAPQPAANPATSSAPPPAEAEKSSAIQPPVPKFLTDPHPSITGIAESSPTKTRPGFLPAAIGLTAMVTVTSGIYLYLQGAAIWDRVNGPSTPTTVASAPREIVSDQLRQTAMAPERASVPPTAEPPTPAADANTLAVQSALKSASLETSGPKTANTDAEHDMESLDSALTVRVKVKNTKLRAGPGPSFRIVGFANPATDYVVLDWRDRWFKIGPKTAANRAQYSAWIRNDLVNVVR